MFWPDTGTGVDVEPARKPVVDAVRKFFTEGGVGVPPTVPGGDWFNQLTNELLNVLAAAGIDPSKADDDQLAAAITNIAQNVYNQNPKPRYMTISAAKSASFFEGEMVFIFDTGFLYQFRASRYLIPGQSQSEMTYDDIMHVLIDAGGMLQFCDFGKVSSIQAKNSSRFVAKLKGRTDPIKGHCFGDSITYAQAQPDTVNATNNIGVQTGFGDGSTHEHWQFNNSYPAWINSYLSENCPQGNVVFNFGYSGDRCVTGYLRHRESASADFATIMYGVNDCLYATSNGSQPAGLTAVGMYSVENYTLALRLFAAKQILLGCSVTILGTAPFASPVGFDGTQLAAMKLTRSYNSAAKRVASEFGCRFVDVAEDVFSQYGIMEITQEGTHLGEAGLKIAGERIAASLVSIETENRVIHGSTLLANPGLVCLLSKDGVNVLPNSTSTTPKGTLSNERTCLSVSSNWISIPFYAETDSLIAFINGASSAAGATFDIRLDNGALQSDFHFQHDFFSGKPTSQKQLSVNGKFNRDNCNITGDSSATLHVANRGWHTLSIRKVSGDGGLLLDSISFLSAESVIASDVYGVTAHCSVSAGTLDSGARNITSISQDYPGEFVLAFTHKLANNRYTIVVDVNETNADPITITTRYKTTDTCGIAFNKWTGTAWVKFVPTLFTVKILGGR